MEIILLKEISHLGHPGEVIKVKKGYARNYLLSQKYAVKKSKTSLKILEKQKEEFAKLIQEKNAAYKDIIDKLKEVDEINIKVKVGEENKIFGSVTNQQISKQLKDSFDITIDKKQINIKDHIKQLGAYTAAVVLSKEFKTHIGFNVIADDTVSND